MSMLLLGATGADDSGITPVAAILALAPSEWIDASVGLKQTFGGATATVQDDPVGQPLDQSGNALNYSQATAGNRPTLDLTEGFPAINFASASHQYWSHLTGLSLTDHTIFMVAKPVHNGTHMIFAGDNAGDHYVWFGIHLADTGASTPDYYDGTEKTVSMSVANGSWQIFETNRGGTSWKPLRNGQSLISSPLVASGGTQPLTALGSYNAGTFPFNGKWRHFLVFNRTLTTAERNIVLTALASLCNITGATPAVKVVTGGLKGNYNMNATMLKSSGGSLLLGYRNGPSQIGVGRVYMKRAATVAGLATATPYAVSPDPAAGEDWRIGENAIAQMGDGTILLPLVKSVAADGTPVTCYLTQSTDDGVTWSAPAAITTPAGYDWMYMYGRIFTPNGGTTWYVPAYAQKTSNGRTDAILLTSTTPKIAASWTLKGVIIAGTVGNDANETSVTFKDATNFVAFTRIENLAVGILQVATADSGATWGTPAAIPGSNAVGGISPDLFVTADGDFLLNFASRANNPTGIYTLRSTDQAATFKTPLYPISCIQQIDGANGVGTGYPSMVELSHNVFIIPYYIEPGLTNGVAAEIFITTVSLASLPA